MHMAAHRWMRARRLRALWPICARLEDRWRPSNLAQSSRHRVLKHPGAQRPPHEHGLVGWPRPGGEWPLLKHFADLQSQLVPLGARSTITRPSSPTSGHSLNSLYRIIVFLTCDARKNIDFSQLELADHGGRRLIRIVGGRGEHPAPRP